MITVRVWDQAIKLACWAKAPAFWGLGRTQSTELESREALKRGAALCGSSAEERLLGGAYREGITETMKQELRGGVQGRTRPAGTDL